MILFSAEAILASSTAKFGMDGMTMKDKCTKDRMQVCSSLHFVRVYVRRIIHVIVHNGLTVVEGVHVVVHTFT